MAMLSIFITFVTVTYVCQQYKGNASLCFFGNNGYANMPYYLAICTFCLPCFSDIEVWINLVEVFKLKIVVCYCVLVKWKLKYHYASITSSLFCK
jgi:hypothetical protein